MKITDVRTILLTGPCTLDPFLSESRKLRSASFIVIETDTELTGIGETYAGYFFPEGVTSIVEFFKPILIGNSVDDIPGLWNRMYHCGNFWCRVGLGAIVLAGIEAALWDLKGKAENLPVYKLLKEYWNRQSNESTKPPPCNNDHKSLLCYATGGPSNYPLHKLEKKIDFYCSLGFNGVKIGAGSFMQGKGFEISDEPVKASEFEAQKMSFIRQRFGNDLKLMLDAHMGNSPDKTWGMETAVSVAKALEEFDLLFLEEPLSYLEPELYRVLREQTKTTIAGGECLTAICEWETFINAKSFGVGQPDASFTSGLSHFIQIAAKLHANDARVAPHAWGAGGSQMQNIHCAFACPNTIIVEVAPAYGPLHSELIKDAMQIKNGRILPPEKPGLGIALTEDIIERFPFIPGTGEFNSVPGKILST